MSFFHFMYFKARVPRARPRESSKPNRPDLKHSVEMENHTLITDWCQLLFWVLEIPCRPQASGPLAHGIPSLGSLSGFPVESRGSRSTFFRWAAAALGYTAEHWIPFWKGIPFSASPPGACTETGLFNRCISLISRCIPFVHFGFVAVTRFGDELRTLLQTRNVLCSLWCAGNKEVL